MADIFNPISIRFAADDDESVDVSITSQSSYVAAAHRFELDTIVGEIAPDATKDPALTVMAHIPPNEDGSYIFELATSLPYYLPRLKKKSEYILNVDGNTLFVCLRMVRCFVGVGLESSRDLSYLLIHRRALPHLLESGFKHIHPVPLKTFISRRFHCVANSVEDGIRYNFKIWRESLIADISKVVDVMRVTKEPGAESLLPQLALASFPVFWVVVDGGNGKTGAFQISGDLASAAFRSLYDLGTDTSAAIEKLLKEKSPVPVHEEALALALTFTHYGHFDLAIVQICVACESVLFKTYAAFLSSRGVSKTKIAENKKELTFSQLLNLHLFSMADINKLEKATEIVGWINWARKHRNEAVHGGKVQGNLNAAEVKNAIEAAQKLTNFLLNGDVAVERDLPALSEVDLSAAARKVQEKFWLSDLATYRKLETWGASLFLAAIGVLTRELLEWTRSHEASKAVDVPKLSFIAPALLGIIALIYLRVVNGRVRVAQEQVHLLGQIPLPDKRPGALGWIFAFTPLVFGFGGSLALTYGGSSSQLPLLVLAVVAATIVGWFIHYQVSHSKSNLTARQ
ncbi:MAG TPA: hypothetical protein VHQ47_10000 [Phycisphaerae bacterium]|nr:hypothetical protein [Phycisphaerae bacterium]